MPKTAQEKTTEETILIAAQKIFTSKGYAGTRMQAIADEAGINKAMLHYYFRSKDKLFQKILNEALDSVAPVIMNALRGEGSVMEKLEILIREHTRLLFERPYMPLFILHELSQNRENFVPGMVARDGGQEAIAGFLMQVVQEGQEGKIRPIHPVHLMMHTMGLIVFPFIVKPIIERAAGISEADFDELMRERVAETTAFVRAGLAPVG